MHERVLFDSPSSFSFPSFFLFLFHFRCSTEAIKIVFKWTLLTTTNKSMYKLRNMNGHSLSIFVSIRFLWNMRRISRFFPLQETWIVNSMTQFIFKALFNTDPTTDCHIEAFIIMYTQCISKLDSHNEKKEGKKETRHLVNEHTSWNNTNVKWTIWIREKEHSLNVLHFRLVGWKLIRSIHSLGSSQLEYHSII